MKGCHEAPLPLLTFELLLTFGLWLTPAHPLAPSPPPTHRRQRRPLPAHARSQGAASHPGPRSQPLTSNNRDPHNATMKLFYTLSAVLLAAAPAHAGLSLSVRDLTNRLPDLRLWASLLVRRRECPPHPVLACVGPPPTLPHALHGGAS